MRQVAESTTNWIMMMCADKRRSCQERRRRFLQVFSEANRRKLGDDVVFMPRKAIIPLSPGSPLKLKLAAVSG